MSTQPRQQMCRTGTKTARKSPTNQQKSPREAVRVIPSRTALRLGPSGGHLRKGCSMEPKKQLPQDRRSGFGSHPFHGSPYYDCETASLIRAILLPVFAGASSWSDLIDCLHDKGYRLVFRDGALCLIHLSRGYRVCGLRFLGLSLPDLVDRLGRPCVLAHPGQEADGDVLRHPPNRLTVH